MEPVSLAKMRIDAEANETYLLEQIDRKLTHLERRWKRPIPQAISERYWHRDGATMANTAQPPCSNHLKTEYSPQHGQTWAKMVRSTPQSKSVPPRKSYYGTVYNRQTPREGGNESRVVFQRQQGSKGIGARCQAALAAKSVRFYDKAQSARAFAQPSRRIRKARNDGFWFGKQARNNRAVAFRGRGNNAELMLKGRNNRVNHLIKPPESRMELTPRPWKQKCGTRPDPNIHVGYDNHVQLDQNNQLHVCGVVASNRSRWLNNSQHEKQYCDMLTTPITHQLRQLWDMQKLFQHQINTLVQEEKYKQKMQQTMFETRMQEHKAWSRRQSYLQDSKIKNLLSQVEMLTSGLAKDRHTEAPILEMNETIQKRQPIARPHLLSDQKIFNKRKQNTTAAATLRMKPDRLCKDRSDTPAHTGDVVLQKLRSRKRITRPHHVESDGKNGNLDTTTVEDMTPGTGSDNRGIATPTSDKEISVLGNNTRCSGNEGKYNCSSSPPVEQTSLDSEQRTEHEQLEKLEQGQGIKIDIQGHPELKQLFDQCRVCASPGPLNTVVTASLNGCNVSTLLDTGSFSSLVPRRTVDTLSLVMDSTKMKLISLSGKDLPIIGEIRATVAICGKTTTTSIAVIEDLWCDMLLGTEALTRMGKITFDFPNRVVQIGNSMITMADKRLILEEKCHTKDLPKLNTTWKRPQRRQHSQRRKMRRIPDVQFSVENSMLSQVSPDLAKFATDGVNLSNETTWPIPLVPKKKLRAAEMMSLTKASGNVIDLPGITYEKEIWPKRPWTKRIPFDLSQPEKYRIGHILGEGGFGTVYAGRRILNGMAVAIKVIKKYDIGNWEMFNAQRVPREVLLLHYCQSVNGVIRLLDWGVWPDSYYIVMERPASSQDLFQYIQRYEYVAPEVVRDIFRQVVKAVAECWKLGVVHRDLKPENILIDLDTQRITLIDFGCAAYNTGGPFTDPAGTYLYLPPEWFTTRSYMGKEAAVWSLGIILYQIMCGDVPYLRTKNIGCNDLTFSRNVAPHCKELIRWCLASDPCGRPDFGQILDHSWMLDTRKIHGINNVLWNANTKNGRGSGNIVAETSYNRMEAKNSIDILIDRLAVTPDTSNITVQEKKIHMQSSQHAHKDSNTARQRKSDIWDGKRKVNNETLPAECTGKMTGLQFGGHRAQDLQTGSGNNALYTVVLSVRGGTKR